jgi:hypothetical protein
MLIIDKKYLNVKLGIIDYLQQYNLRKEIENRYINII